MKMIVAVDKKWGIGCDNCLLISIPKDMQYFKENTLGKVVVMGRKTLESMPGAKSLPKRTNIVLTTNRSFEAERCIVVHSEEEMFDEIAKYNPDDVYLIGGASIYNKFYKLCDKLYITKIDAELNADTFIINIDEDDDYEMVSESNPITENGVTYRFCVYERKNKE